MSDFSEIVDSYVNGLRTLEETVDDLLCLQIGHGELLANYTDGTWTELDRMLNDGSVSFSQSRAITNAYDTRTKSEAFHILGQDYGVHQIVSPESVHTQ